MKLEEVLPALRKGRRIKSGSVIVCMKNNRLTYVYEHNQPDSNFRDGFVFDETSLAMDNWEIVSEPNKFEAWINLDSCGHAYIWRTKEEADEFAHSNRIECRKIEWEVGE